MLEMSVDDTVILGAEEFSQYVLDRWTWSRFATSTNKSYAVGCPVPRSPHNDEVEGKRQINPPWIRSSEIPFALYGSRCMLGFKRRFFLTMAFVSSMLFPQQSDCASGPKLALVPPGKKESVADTLLRHDGVGRLPVGWSNSTI